MFFLILISSNVFANTNYFNEGLAFYKNKEFDKAKFKFEQDIVFNPKSEMSYLYLSKIFNNLDNKYLEEQNLKLRKVEILAQRQVCWSHLILLCREETQ